MNFWTTYTKATLSNPPKWWGRFSEVVRKTKGNYFVEIPAFSYPAIQDTEASYIITEFRLLQNIKVTIPRLPLLIPNNASFCLAIRSPVNNADGLSITRYKLWSNVGEIFYFPDYEGQVIQGPCVFEIWTIPGITDVDLVLPYRIYLGLLANPGTSIQCSNAENNQLNLVQVCELFANKNGADYDLPLVFQYCQGEITPPPGGDVGIITEDGTGKITTEDGDPIITEDQ